MSSQAYRFTFKLFGKKVQMIESGNMGVVVEKESDVICVYGTDAGHSTIFCAIPICHPKYLKGQEFVVAFPADGIATVCVGDIRVVIDFAGKKCSNNKGLRDYGSDTWGEGVSAPWDMEKEKWFQG